MNLDTLEQLADARLERKYCCNDPDCSCRNARDNFIYEITPATIKSLIALVRMQNDALSAIYIYRHGQKIVDWERIDAAIAAYERFNKGE